jgi:ribonucleoside-triphosphate reductase
MGELQEKNIEIKVIKRDGKRVDFDGTKIALAIKKGFDSVKQDGEDEDLSKYNEKDVYKIYSSVIARIEKLNTGKMHIEEIQDMIEEELQKSEYTEVYESFANYRERRSQSRKLFFDEKQQHKFLKALENLGLKSSTEENSKRENANIDGDTAMGTMLQYGSTVSKEFAKSYLMKRKFAEAHDSGEIHIHDMDFMPMGTTTCCQLDIGKLFKDGFSTGHGHLREPNDIMSYSALAAIAIQANQNDQHGGQSIPAFDFFLAPGVLKTFKKQFKQCVYDFLELTDFNKFIAMNGVTTKIDKLESITFDISIFDEYCRNSEELLRLFRLSAKKALEKTNRITYQAMEAFIHNLNTMHSRAGAQVPFSSINLGTDISPEGRMIIKNFLLATDSGLGKSETPIFPISIFKVKEGVNYNEEDPNYDLFKLACSVSAKRLFPNFSFIDSKFNKQFYKEGDYNTEVAYMGCRTRVLANAVDPSKSVTSGRGNISFTSINLPRIGIKHGIVNNDKANLKAFYAELEEKMELVKDQLLERFDIQCNKRIYNFPFLLRTRCMDG